MVRDTAPQHHPSHARPWRQWPGTGRRAGAGRDTAPQHQAHVAQPGYNDLGEGGGRAWAETLCLNTTLRWRVRNSLREYGYILRSGGGAEEKEGLFRYLAGLSMDDEDFEASVMEDEDFEASPRPVESPAD